jgi:hypothetical protein
VETWTKARQIPSAKVVKAILKILPRISEEQLLRFPIVRKNLERISLYPDGTDFVKSLLIQVRRNVGRLSKSCLGKFAENLIFSEFVAARQKREEFYTRYGFHPPFFLVLSLLSVLPHHGPSPNSAPDRKRMQSLSDASGCRGHFGCVFSRHGPICPGVRRNGRCPVERARPFHGEENVRSKKCGYRVNGYG